MIRIQLLERLTSTTQDQSFSCAERTGFASGNAFNTDRFSWCNGIFGGILDGGTATGPGQRTFMYRPYSLLSLGNDYLSLVEQAINGLAKQPVWRLSIRQSLEHRTTHRSRERRQLAMFSM